MRTAQHVKDIMPETTNSGHLSVNFYHDKFSTLDMHHICTNTSSWCAMGGTSRLGDLRHDYKIEFSLLL
jgi:hypothetical protein